jgi:hypothetical protein
MDFIVTSFKKGSEGSEGSPDDGVAVVCFGGPLAGP